MKIKCLILALILMIFTGCSKVEEFTQDANEIKETYDEVKKQVNGVIQVVEKSGLDLENIETKDLEEVIEGVSKITGDDIESIEDISNFGEFQATKFASRNEESISNGYVTEYYSSASFDEVVTHYKAMLEGTEDYDIIQYPDSYTRMSGMIGGVFVQFGIEKTEDEETYIVYQYEAPMQVAENGEVNNTRENTLTDYSLAFDKFYNNQIEIFEGNPDIIIREEIGKLDFEEIKEDWNSLGYKQNVYMNLVMTSTDSETGTFNSTADVFIKGENINMTIYTDYGEITAIYNASKNQTYYKNSKATGFKTEDGCSLPFRLLDLNDFEYMENHIADGQYMPQYLEDTKDGSKTALIWFFEGDTWGNFGYDFDKRILDAYTEEGMEMIYNDTYPEGKEFPYSQHWHATEIKTDIDINDDLFTW
ncbi:MAG: hypothetical protein N4A68_13565 [Maledivibacter sp.]|jgi:hypothetical protein|nr:hypothetical protein [Maledivibacter sp.]